MSKYEEVCSLLDKGVDSIVEAPFGNVAGDLETLQYQTVTIGPCIPLAEHILGQNTMIQEVRASTEDIVSSLNIGKSLFSEAIGGRKGAEHFLAHYALIGVAEAAKYADVASSGLNRLSEIGLDVQRLHASDTIEDYAALLGQTKIEIAMSSLMANSATNNITAYLAICL